jgi:nucleoside-diphosphate-sugar epimerase
MAEQVKKERILMTGASGYIGSRITTFAIAEGYEVYGLSRSEKSDDKLKTLGAVPVRGDLHAVDVLRRESAQAQFVIHLADAWDISLKIPYDEVLRIDAAAVDAMGEGLKGRGRLITTSGTLVVAPDPDGGETTEESPLLEDPVNLRIKAELYALGLCKKGIDVCTVRLAPYVYGRGGSGVRMIMQIAVGNGEVLYVGDGQLRTSVVHVDDAARLYLLVCKKGKAGDKFNGASSTEVTTYGMVHAMASTLDLPVRSADFEEVTSKCGFVFAKFMTSENRGSNAKAVKQLGWQPREPGVIDDIKTGSYVEAAKEMKSDA